MDGPRVDAALIERLHHLARLRPDPATAPALARDLRTILAYVGALAGLPPDDEAPEQAEQAVGAARVGDRPDQVVPGLRRAELLAGAPAVRDDTFAMPPTRRGGG